MKRTKMTAILVLVLGLMVCTAELARAAPMGTAFTYQGRLMDKNRPADGLYDFQFKLYDSNDPCTGTQLASPIDINDLDVIDGHFVVELDFGSGIFDGNAVWLETRIVRSPMGSDPAALSPLLELTPTPYALYAKTAGGTPGGVSGGGTADYIAKFTGPNTIGDSVIYESGGNVGIGTTSPEAKLSIQMPRGAIMRPSTVGGLVIKHNLLNIANQLEVKDPSGNTRFVVDNTGNVGIGTTSPTEALEVNGTVKATAFSGDGSGLTNLPVIADSDWTISGNDMYSAVSGNVGIGTTTPSEKLEINGNININSVYKIGGDSVLSALGTENILVGIGAGANNTGLCNTFLGNYAGYSNTEGHSNTFLGRSAGYSNTTGLRNIFIGSSAGNSNTTGYDNTFLGTAAGFWNTAGLRNIFIGSSAGNSNTTGYCNTFSGYSAGLHNTTGYHNTFLGDSAGRYNTTGSYNTFVGDLAGRHNTTGAGNVFIGNQAGYNETGSNKLYIANSTADPPLIYGDFSTGRVGIGTTSPSEKLDVNGNINVNSVYKIKRDTVLSTLGTDNTFVGIKAGANNTTGYNNTFSGYAAGQSNTTGRDNTFSGYGAGWKNSTGNSNTFLGRYAGYSNTTGYGNTFSGRSAGYSNTEGSDNTFLGTAAGRYNTTGSHNTFLGIAAGSDNTTGYNNTFLGEGAGFRNTTGKYNTFLGHAAGNSNTTGTGNVFIGYHAGYDETGSDKLYIANSYANPPLIYGDFDTGRVGIGTLSPQDKLEVSGGMMTLDGGPGGDITGIRIRENDDMRWTFLYKTWDAADKLYIRDEVGGRDVMTFEPTTGNVGIGTTNPLGFKLAVNGSAAKPGGGSWSVYSDRRLKKNIEPLSGALDRMLQLEGVSFEYSNSDHFSYVEGEQVGMIAQEVEKVFPDWVDENGGYKTVTYRGFEAITVEAFRQLRKEKDAEITALKEQLRTQNESFDQRLSALESMMTQRPVGITREVQ
jgi:hypothetical protein